MKKKVATLEEVEEGNPPAQEENQSATSERVEKPPEQPVKEQQEEKKHCGSKVLKISVAIALAAAAVLGILYGVEKSKSGDDSSCDDDDSNETIKYVSSFLNECNELEAKQLTVDRAHDDTSLDGQLYDFPPCDDGTGDPNYNGILYNWTGTDKVTTIDLCDDRTSFDSYVSVYKCSDNGLLSCVAANNDMGEELCQDGPTNSQVQWPAEQGVDYLVLVHGNGDNEKGSFDMYIHEGDEIVNSPSSITCRDLKANALPLFHGEGNTLTAPTYDYLPACVDDGIPNYQGVLYFWTGRGRWMTIDTCNGYNSFDTYISVYWCDNESNEVICVTANNDEKGGGWCGEGGSSRVIWPAESTVDYFILVHGNGNVGMGAFELNVHEGDELPTSSTATCGSNTVDVYSAFGGEDYYYHGEQLGYTKSSPIYNDLESCEDGGDPNYQGNMYYVQGMGRWAIATIPCYHSSASDYDTYISVYECNDNHEFSCVAANNNGNEYNCGSESLSSNVMWPAEDGRRYFVLVHGNGEDATGFYRMNFQLGQDIPAASTVSCGTNYLEAYELATYNSYIGDTSDSPIHDDLPLCEEGGNPNYKGTMYHWEGTGRWANVEISCHDPTDYDTYMSVYKCDDETGDLYCVAANNDQGYCEQRGSKVSWPAEDGVDYFVLAHGNGDDATGHFEIRLDEGQEIPIPSVITCGTRNFEGFEVQPWESFDGETTSAIVHESLPTCEDGGNPNYQGVLFYYRGSGRYIDAEISCYEPTDFDTYISVYECGFGNLSCVTSNDDDEHCHRGGASKATWAAKNGYSYLILVHGEGSGSDATGNFQIRLNEGDTIPTPVAPCGNITAIGVNLGRTIAGSTHGSVVYENIAACSDGDSNPSYQGTMYGITGTGQWTTISTCDWDTDFDTYISVYECETYGGLTCVTANNDLNRACNERGGQHSSEVVWFAQPGVNYYILIHGNNGQTGEFRMHINTN